MKLEEESSFFSAGKGTYQQLAADVLGRVFHG